MSAGSVSGAKTAIAISDVVTCTRCQALVPVRQWWSHSCERASPIPEPEPLVLTEPPSSTRIRRRYVRPGPIGPRTLAGLIARGKACPSCGRLWAPGARCNHPLEST